MDNKKIAQLVREENGKTINIIKETDSDILTDDLEECKLINYHVGNMTKDWLAKRIIFTDSAREYDYFRDNIVSLLSSLDKNMLITLNHIYITKSEDDIQEVCANEQCDEDWFPECIDYKYGGALGCLWSQFNSVIIDMSAIEKCIAQMEKEAKEYGESFNYGKELGIGLYSTLTHEIRHLGLSNPFLGEEEYPAVLGSEKNIEAWGREAFEDWYVL